MNKEVKWVEVRDSKEHEWEKRILVDTFNDGSCRCVDTSVGVVEYRKGDCYTTCKWNMWREIKEPIYKPYESLTEEVIKKLKGQWIRGKNGSVYCAITGFHLKNNIVELADYNITLRDLFLDWTFEDGNPIGELVE